MTPRSRDGISTLARGRGRGVETPRLWASRGSAYGSSSVGACAERSSWSVMVSRIVLLRAARSAAVLASRNRFDEKRCRRERRAPAIAGPDLHHGPPDPPFRPNVSQSISTTGWLGAIRVILMGPPRPISCISASSLL